jgi:hypothetical protein
MMLAEWELGQPLGLQRKAYRSFPLPCRTELKTGLSFAQGISRGLKLGGWMRKDLWPGKEKSSIYTGEETCYVHKNEEKLNPKGRLDFQALSPP